MSPTRKKAGVAADLLPEDRRSQPDGEEQQLPPAGDSGDTEVPPPARRGPELEPGPVSGLI